MKTVTDTLTLPGWFVLDECMINSKPYQGNGIKGFEWRVYSMPDDYVIELRKNKHKKEP